MSDERVFSLRNRWFAASVGGTVLIALIGILIGFIWLPSVQPDFSVRGIWGAICSAAGTPSTWFSGDNVRGTAPSEVVVLPPRGRVQADSASIGRGATIATQNCTMCHGVIGTVQVTAPALAGQYAEAIYKELRDYKDGLRASAIMQPIIAARSDQDFHDLANYYAWLPRVGPEENTAAQVAGQDATAQRLAMQGDPMRNIAACAACHGQIDRKGGAPWLGGQSSEYLRGQLLAFANGSRHNDINEQMRNVARQLSADEMDALANYYAGQK
jgi:cytochrome c553